jgi:hypothetical protein
MADAAAAAAAAAAAPVVAPVPAAPAPAAVHVHVPELRSVAPNKFAGQISENGTWWLQKFEAYMARQHIVGDNRLEAFILFITGPCENWYMLLNNNNKDTYDHLRAAFLARYAGVAHNRHEEEIFHTKFQLPTEAAHTFINDMTSIGTKLQLPEITIVSTIKRGLLPAIRLHVLSHDVNTVAALIEHTAIAESYLPLLYNRVGFTPLASTEAPIANIATTAAANANTTSTQLNELKQTNAEIKDIVGNLSKLFTKMHISAVEPQTTNNRATTGFQQNFSRGPRPQNNDYARRPFCNFCKMQGHTYDNCRRRLNSRPMAPQMQYRPRAPQYQPQYTANNGNTGYRPRYPQQQAYMGQPYNDTYTPYAYQPQQYPNIPEYPGDQYLN